MTEDKDLQDEIDFLFQAYRDRLPQQKETLLSLFSQFASVRTKENLSKFSDEIHGLAGTGTTFGFPIISQHSQGLENFLVSFLCEEGDPKKIDLVEFQAKFNQLLMSINESIESAGENKKRSNESNVNPEELEISVIKKPFHICILEEKKELSSKLQSLFNGEEIEAIQLPTLSQFKNSIDRKTPDLVLLAFKETKSEPLKSLLDLSSIRSRSGKSFHIVFISEDSNFETRIRASQCGTDFFLSTPIVIEEVKQAIDLIRTHDSKDPYRILIVDDDENLAEFYAVYLKSSGLTVETLSDPTKIMEVIDNFKPELIMLDNNMPGYTGMEVAGIIRQSMRHSSIPIIFMSTEARIEEQLISRNIGGDYFLCKPIDPKTLVNTISIRVSRARRQSELYHALQKSNAEAKKAKEDAIQAASHKATFLANMSHEIRTPLNSILGTLQILSEEQFSDEIKDLLRIQKSSSEILLALINDILDFSKIEAGKITIEKLECDVAAIVEESMQLFSGPRTGKDLLIESRYDHEIPWQVIADPIRLKQILMNLISNAIKFTEKGRVSVHAKLQRREEKEGKELATIRFSVKDSGIGMDEDQIRNLFKAFSQADLSTTRKYGGTGLGLAISKRLVNIMGPDIK